MQKSNFSTKSGAPWKLIFYEAYLSEVDAKRREKYYNRLLHSCNSAELNKN